MITEFFDLRVIDFKSLNIKLKTIDTSSVIRDGLFQKNTGIVKLINTWIQLGIDAVGSKIANKLVIIFISRLK